MEQQYKLVWVKMCGSFDVDARDKQIRNMINKLPSGMAPVKTGNIFPGQNALTMVLKDGQEAFESMLWGFPRWDGKGVVFNARAETALQKPMFARPLRQNPAVVPCTGFYEWKFDPEMDKKQKYKFNDPDSAILYLAGFWNEFPKQDQGPAFTILTTAANASMLPYHHRMPILLKESDVGSWLSGQNLNSILSQTPFAVEASKACQHCI